MKTKESISLISWIMVLAILVSSFSPLSVFATDGAGMNPTGDYQDTGEPKNLLISLFGGAGMMDTGAGKDVTNLLKPLDITLKVGNASGAEITDGTVLDISKPIYIQALFDVPVLGDFTDADPAPDPSQYVVHGDTATFELSNKFVLSGAAEEVSIPLLAGDDTPVGRVVLKKSSNVAEIIFDGNPNVFNGSKSSVSCNFEAVLEYDSSGGPLGPGDNTITFLEKDYTLKGPDLTTTYEVTKAGTANLAEGTITWTVNITAKQNGTDVTLEGYQFYDD